MQSFASFHFTDAGSTPREAMLLLINFPLSINGLVYDEALVRIEINFAPQRMTAKLKRQKEIRIHPLRGFRPENSLKAAAKNMRHVTNAIRRDETS